MLKNNAPATPTLYGEDAKAVIEELKNSKSSPETKEKGEKSVEYFKQFERGENNERDKLCFKGYVL